MWQTKSASAIPKNLGLGVDFWPCSEGDFLTGHRSTMRFPLKKLLPTVAAICLLGLLSIGNLKPLNNKEDSGTASNVTKSFVDKYHLYTELTNVCKCDFIN